MAKALNPSFFRRACRMAISRNSCSLLDFPEFAQAVRLSCPRNSYSRLLSQHPLYQPCAHPYTDRQHKASPPVSGAPIASPLERLFQLGIEFHRRLRIDAHQPADCCGLQTSYVLQSGYEPLLRVLGPLTARDVETLTERLNLAGDARDVLKARDSVKQLLGISPLI